MSSIDLTVTSGIVHLHHRERLFGRFNSGARRNSSVDISARPDSSLSATRLKPASVTCSKSAVCSARLSATEPEEGSLGAGWRHGGCALVGRPRPGVFHRGADWG